jgi:hypothetical protein
MKCNYKNIQCAYIETGGECESCEHYDKGIRETGAMPDLSDWFKWVDKIPESTIRRIKFWFAAIVYSILLGSIIYFFIIHPIK